MVRAVSLKFTHMDIRSGVTGVLGCMLNHPSFHIIASVHARGEVPTPNFFISSPKTSSRHSKRWVWSSPSHTGLAMVPAATSVWNVPSVKCHRHMLCVKWCGVWCVLCLLQCFFVCPLNGQHLSGHAFSLSLHLALAHVDCHKAASNECDDCVFVIAPLLPFPCVCARAASRSSLPLRAVWFCFSSRQSNAWTSSKHSQRRLPPPLPLTRAPCCPPSSPSSRRALQRAPC